MYDMIYEHIVYAKNASKLDEPVMYDKLSHIKNIMYGRPTQYRLAYTEMLIFCVKSGIIEVSFLTGMLEEGE